jgi:hypothetical protein
MINTNSAEYLLPDPKPTPEIDPDSTEGTPEIEPTISPVIPLPDIR